MTIEEPLDITSATFGALMCAAGLEARAEQSQYAIMAEAALSDLGKIGLLHADTGLGKSLGYLIPAMQRVYSDPRHPRIIVATHSHALMQQLLEKDCAILTRIARAYGVIPLTVGRLLGRVNFVSPERVDAAVQGLELSALDSRMLADLRTWSGTIAEYEDEFGGLPCELLASQICMTNDCDNEELDAMQRREAACDIVVTTHAMVAIDMLRGNAVLKGLDRPTMLIVDEADALAGQLQEWTQRRLNLVRFYGSLRDHLSMRHLQPLESAIADIKALLGDRHYAWDSELASIARGILSMLSKLLKLKGLDETLVNTLEQQLRAVTAPTLGLGVSHERHEPAIVALNPWFAKNFGRYASTHFDSAMLTSGTLSITPDPVNGTAWIRHDLGIDETMLGVNAIFSPHHYGHMTLSLAGPGFPQIYGKHEKGGDQSPPLSDAWLQAVAHHITNRPGRVVVLTVSHEESRKLAKLLTGIERRPLLVHQQGEPLKHVIAEFSNLSTHHKGAVMLTAAGHTGLNIVDTQGGVGFDRLVLTRIAYAKPRTAEIDAMASYYLTTQKRDVKKMLQRQEHIRTANAAIRLMRQALGRGIRSPDDCIAVDICDPRFPLSHDLSSRHAKMRNIIPPRFLAEYQRAGLLLSNSDIHQPAPEEVFF